MNKITKLFLIALSAVSVSAACIALSGCADNSSGGNVTDNGGSGNTGNGGSGNTGNGGSGNTGNGGSGNTGNGGSGNTGNGGNNGGGTDAGNKETYVSYRLDGFVYSVSGQGEYYIDADDMSATDHAAYDAVIAMYGREVKISDKNIQFVDGTVLSAFGKTAYSLDGVKVSFSDSALSQSFNYVKLSDGIFSMGVQQKVAGMTVTYSFDYYSPDAVAPSFEVTFDSNGGGAVESQTVNKGSTVTKPADPQKAGYKFGGWYSDEKCTSEWKFGGNKIFADVVLYAKWTANENIVTFFTDGGTSVPEQSVFTGNKIKKPADPQKAGYNFAGWYEDSSTQKAWDFSSAVTEDITLYAKFTPASYWLSLDACGGTCDIAEKNVKYLEKVGALPLPQRNGFEFGGWYDGASGGSLYTADTTYIKTEPITLYAKWDTVITLDTDGLGSVSESESVAVYGRKQSDVQSLPDAVCDDAEFAGWFTQPGGQGQKYGNSDVYYFNGPVTLYAAWRLAVGYDAAGGSSVNNSTVIRGGSFVPGTTERTGYTFAGWYDSEGNPVDENTVINKNTAFTLTARWQANTVTFNFDAQGGTCANQSLSCLFDGPLGEMPVPEKAGNVFGGWFTQPAGAGRQYVAESVCDTAATVTLYAKWTADVIFEYEGATSGNTVEKLSFTYKTAININLPEPYKTGWSFEGWFSEQNGAGMRLMNNSFGDSSVWNSDGNIHIYAYWVKGTDKRYLTYTATNPVTVTGLADKSLTELDIPAIINLKPVTAVSQNAFANSGLTTVTVPDSVTDIGNGAFKNCKLTEITIPFVGRSTTGTMQYEKVFGYIFGYERKSSWNEEVENAVLQYESNSSGSAYYWYYVPKTLEKVTITGSYAIPQYALNKCAMLKEVNLPEGITSIPAYAFADCTNLTKITGLNGVREVEERAFRNCSLLTTFPAVSLTEVGALAFYNCTKLTGITLGEGLEVIGEHAFNMTGLTEIRLPAGLKTIGEYAFRSTALTSVTVPGSVTGIGNGAFKNCKLTEITIPFVGANTTNSTYAGVGAFGYIFGCERKSFWNEEVENAVLQYESDGSDSGYYWYFIPATLEKVTVTGSYAIPQYAFNKCAMLKEVNLPEGITSIPAYAFSDCTNLTKITGLNGVKEVEERAFRNCSLLTTFPAGPLTKVGALAFYNCTKLTAIELGEGLTEIGEHAFNMTGLTEIQFPAGLKTIGEYAFRSTALTSVTVPDSVTGIGNGAFKNCKLTEITIPFVGANTTNSTYAGVGAFGYIFGFERKSFWNEEVENAVMQYESDGSDSGYYWYFIPTTLEKVTVTGSYAIPQYAFNKCAMLKEINFTAGVSAIGNYALSGCTGLQTLGFGGELPQTFESNALSGLSSEVVLIVPDENVEDYKTVFAGFTVKGKSEGAL